MYTQEDVKKVQARLLEMAKIIRNILEKNDIPYFITYGTLLGAVRHKGFIPWDDDFDFYLFDDSYDRALDALRKELPDDLFVEYRDSEPLYYHGWAHIKDLNSRTECELFPDDGRYTHKGISVDLYRTVKIHKEEETLLRTREHIEYLNRKISKNMMPRSEYDSRMLKLSKQYEAESKRLSQLSDLGPEMYGFFIIYKDKMYMEEMFPLKRYQFEDTEFWGPNNADAMLSRCYKNYMELPPIEKRCPHYSNVFFLDK